MSSLPHPPVEDVTTSTITVTTSVQHMLQLNSSQGSLSSMLDLSFPEPSTRESMPTLPLFILLCVRAFRCGLELVRGWSCGGEVGGLVVVRWVVLCW